MQGIFEQTIFAINYAEEVKKVKTFKDIANLFTRLFGIAPTVGANGYKNETSDYGLKARGIKAREKLNEQCGEFWSESKSPKI